MSPLQSVRVRTGDAAAQRRAKAIRDDANGAAGGPLGDPTTLEKSALFEFLTRPPPRPRGVIPVHPSTDAKAILRRVLAEGAGDEDGRVRTTDRSVVVAEAERRREYERRRKQAWRASRKAAGLPTSDTAGQRARRARRRAAAEAWHEGEATASK